MGISSDGILYFGFQVGGDEELPEWMEDYEEFDEFLLAKAGLPLDTSWQESKAIREACPVDLQTYCSYDYPMYILGIRGAEYRAHRGYVVEIGAEMAVPQDRIDAAKSWCEANGIEWHDPKWLLCSMYG
jgi:hypothetical protein